MQEIHLVSWILVRVHDAPLLVSGYSRRISCFQRSIAHLFSFSQSRFYAATPSFHGDRAEHLPYSVLYSVLENYATAKPSFRSKLFLKQVEPMLELNYFWLAKSDQLNITLSDHETQYIG